MKNLDHKVMPLILYILSLIIPFSQKVAYVKSLKLDCKICSKVLGIMRHDFLFNIFSSSPKGSASVVSLGML